MGSQIFTSGLTLLDSEGNGEGKKPPSQKVLLVYFLADQKLLNLRRHFRDALIQMYLSLIPLLQKSLHQRYNIYKNGTHQPYITPPTPTFHLPQEIQPKILLFNVLEKK